MWSMRMVASCCVGIQDPAVDSIIYPKMTLLMDLHKAGDFN